MFGASKCKFYYSVLVFSRKYLVSLISDVATDAVILLPKLITELKDIDV